MKMEKIVGFVGRMNEISIIVGKIWSTHMYFGLMWMKQEKNLLNLEAR